MARFSNADCTKAEKKNTPALDFARMRIELWTAIPVIASIDSRGENRPLVHRKFPRGTGMWTPRYQFVIRVYVHVRCNHGGQLVTGTQVTTFNQAVIVKASGGNGRRPRPSPVVTHRSARADFARCHAKLGPLHR